MRLAIVVQRYGLEITGGAELHARLVAEHLAPRHDVTILTTCARDYVTWANAYPRGVTNVDGLTVWRFPVRRPRDPERFGRLQEQVFHRDHTRRQAHAWLDAQGPYAPTMIRWIEANAAHFDYAICFSYRYWTTFHALRVADGRGILVPTAEPDPAIELPLFKPLFRSPRAIVYNSHEEREMIVDHADNAFVLGDVVGVGIVEPRDAVPERFRARRGIVGPYLLYVGRIDENKGCGQLFEYYRRGAAALAGRGIEPPELVLAGSAVMPIPEHDSIHYLGRIDEDEKHDALAGAEALVMPSFYESLSMVLLEAWALSRPVLVNGHCAVLKGQVTRGRGGLYYMDGDEFTEGLALLVRDERLRRAFGRNGRDYYEANYRWPVIESKYESILERLALEDAAGPAPAGSSHAQ